jgi:hypothetical protein
VQFGGQIVVGKRLKATRREQGWEFSDARGTLGNRKNKNSGNEAKEYLKTKAITFLNGANYTHFACRFAQIAR